MKLENREKVQDLLDLSRKLTFELRDIEKLQKCSTVVIKNRDGWISVVLDVDEHGLWAVFENAENRIKEKLAQIDAQLEEL